MDVQSLQNQHEKHNLAKQWREPAGVMCLGAEKEIQWSKLHLVLVQWRLSTYHLCTRNHLIQNYLPVQK